MSRFIRSSSGSESSGSGGTTNADWELICSRSSSKSDAALQSASFEVDPNEYSGFKFIFHESFVPCITFNAPSICVCPYYWSAASYGQKGCLYACYHCCCASCLVIPIGACNCICLGFFELEVNKSGSGIYYVSRFQSFCSAAGYNCFDGYGGRIQGSMYLAEWEKMTRINLASCQTLSPYGSPWKLLGRKA